MDLTELVRGLQERTARAQPPTYLDTIGGWWLRYAPGCAWWEGTVLPHEDAAPDEVIRRVAVAEEFYAGHGVPARFQISPGGPPGLDTVLAERGYRREIEISLRVADTAQVRERTPTASPRVRCDDGPTPEWLDVWYALHGDDVEPRAEWAMLHRVAQPSGYVSALGDDGEVVAVGRVVSDTGWAGVFGMATLPSVRGKGTGRDLLAGLAGWAADHHVERMYLQVRQDNPAAVRLYERAGFREVCDYHYRVAR